MAKRQALDDPVTSIALRIKALRLFGFLVLVVEPERETGE
jgi:hypothetical protein